MERSDCGLVLSPLSARQRRGRRHLTNSSRRDRIPVQQASEQFQTQGHQARCKTARYAYCLCQAETLFLTALHLPLDTSAHRTPPLSALSCTYQPRGESAPGSLSSSYVLPAPPKIDVDDACEPCLDDLLPSLKAYRLGVPRLGEEYETVRGLPGTAPFVALSDEEGSGGSSDSTSDLSDCEDLSLSAIAEWDERWPNIGDGAWSYVEEAGCAYIRAEVVAVDMDVRAGSDADKPVRLGSGSDESPETSVILEFGTSVCADSATVMVVGGTKQDSQVLRRGEELTFKMVPRSALVLKQTRKGASSLGMLPVVYDIPALSVRRFCATLGLALVLTVHPGV